MFELSAAVSATLARDIYRITKSKEVKAGAAVFASLHGDILNIDTNPDHGSLMKARVGVGILKARCAMGIVCTGKGMYQGHAFVILRGTIPDRAGDLLTDLNVGVSAGPNNMPIHNGFKATFKDLKPKLQQFMVGLRDIHSVHCIGHSLGGALANACAAYIKANIGYSPYLYTFGAPRIGLQGFADKLTSDLKANRIFRVYHRTDLIPCTPFWPYVHAPTINGNIYDYFQPSPGALPSLTWHEMQTYCDTVGQSTWQNLRGKRQQQYSEHETLRWLNETRPVSFNISDIEKLDTAICHVIQKCLNSLGGVITAGFVNGFTIMDRMAYILKNGLSASIKVSHITLLLIKKIMQLLNIPKPIKDKASITQTFIRNLFMRLADRINHICKRILGQVLVNGYTA